VVAIGDHFLSLDVVDMDEGDGLRDVAKFLEDMI
jgi:hypothetical protein